MARCGNLGFRVQGLLLITRARVDVCGRLLTEGEWRQPRTSLWRASLRNVQSPTIVVPPTQTLPFSGFRVFLLFNLLIIFVAGAVRHWRDVYLRQMSDVQPRRSFCLNCAAARYGCPAFATNVIEALAT